MAEKRIPKYLNPVIDLAFKKIFGDQEVMIDFLNDLIHTKLPKITITQVTYLNKDLDGDRKDERGVIYDLRCLTDTGEEFIIEMQNDPQIYFEKRIRYYISKAIVEQGIKTSTENEKYQPWNYNTHPVLGVFFMNFYDKKDRKPICHKAWIDTDGVSGYEPEDPMYWKIQLPYYRKMDKSECKNNIDYWIYNLANMETFTDTLAFTDKKPIFKKVGNIAEYLRLSKAEQNRYWLEWDQLNQEHNKIGYAREEARTETMNEMNIKHIKSLMKKGFSFDKAIEFLEIPKEDIEMIREAIEG